MKVLVSAFSCRPGWGSEPEVGFRAVLAAAERHRVWVLTSDDGADDLRRGLATAGAAQPVEVVSVPFGSDEHALGATRFHVWYDRWQRRVAEVAVDIHRQVDLDLVHHVTFATTWTRVGVAAVPRPLVWGPVGGGVEPPRLLWGTLGARGAAEALARSLGRRAMTVLPHTGVPLGTHVLAQNATTAARLRPHRATVVSNATALDVTELPVASARSREIAVVGRLVAWKGGTLAIRALREVRTPDASLAFYGAGPDEDRLRAAARRAGVADRVTFHGWRPRTTILEHIAAAGVLLHPSLHEEAGMVIAEALAAGTPVVALDHGGPPQVVRAWPEGPWRLVPPGPPARTARALAQAVDAALATPSPVGRPPVPPVSRLADAVLAAYERARPQVSAPR